MRKERRGGINKGENRFERKNRFFWLKISLRVSGFKSE